MVLDGDAKHVCFVLVLIEIKRKDHSFYSFEYVSYLDEDARKYRAH